MPLLSHAYIFSKSLKQNFIALPLLHFNFSASSSSTFLNHSLRSSRSTSSVLKLTFNHVPASNGPCKYFSTLPLHPVLGILSNLPHLKLVSSIIVSDCNCTHYSLLKSALISFASSETSSSFLPHLFLTLVSHSGVLPSF